MSEVLLPAFGALPVVILWVLDRRRRPSPGDVISSEVIRARAETKRAMAEAAAYAADVAWLRSVAGEEGRRLEAARRAVETQDSKSRVVPAWTIPLREALGIDVSWTVPAQRGGDR